MNATAALASLAAAARAAPPPPVRAGGRVLAYDGHTIDCGGLAAEVGAVCLVGRAQTPAEIIGFRDGRTLLMGLAQLGPLLPGAAVLPLGQAARVSVGDALLGRILDGGGRPLDGLPVPRTEARVPLDPAAANPLRRSGVREVLDCGVSGDAGHDGRRGRGGRGCDGGAGAVRCVQYPRHSGDGRNPVASHTRVSEPATQLGSGLRRNDGRRIEGTRHVR